MPSSHSEDLSLYVNPQRRLTDREAIHSLMVSRPRGGWACHGREGLMANHVPFLPDRRRGVARAIEDRDWWLDMLSRLTDGQEARHGVPWHVGDAPASFIGELLRAIVGIEIPSDRLEGKLKASQDAALQDRVGTVHGRHGEGSDEAGSMADLVTQAIEADPARRSWPLSGDARKGLPSDARRRRPCAEDVVDGA
jgi:predicted FMN-binding regulatory protein PaiB